MHATFRNLVTRCSNQVLCLWVLYVNPLPGRNTLPLVILNCMQGLRNPPRHFRIICHELGWRDFHVAMLIPILVYSLEDWISFSSTLRGGGGGLRLLPSLHIRPSLEGSDHYSRDS